VAGGMWVANTSIREAVGRAHLPLTGWDLGEDAFLDLAMGVVRLNHRVDPEPLEISPRQAVDMMRLEVPATERLFGDPCVTPSGISVFVRSIDPHGCWVTHSSDGDEEPACVTHGAWVRANPHLADALLLCVPDVGQYTLDTSFRAALREAVELEAANLVRWHEEIFADAPMLDDPLAVRVAGELLERGGVDVPLRWTDVQGTTWRWVGMSSRGFVFDRDHAFSAHLALPGPEARGWRGDLEQGGLSTTQLRVLNAEQLVFASSALATRVSAWQLAAGVVDATDQVVDLGTRVTRLVTRAQDTLAELEHRASEHLIMSRQLHEAPKKARRVKRHLQRLQANHAELVAGRGMYVWVDEETAPRVGVGLIASGMQSAMRPACDERLRVNESIQSRYLGMFRLAVVGSGAGFGEEATGPKVWNLLDDIETGIAQALSHAPDLEQAQRLAVEAVCRGSENAEVTTPFCSFSAVLTHLDSGRTWMLWSGNCRVWRFRRSVEELAPLTFDQTFDGLTALAVDAGLSREDAVDAMISLSMGKRTRRDIEALHEDERLRAAEKFRAPGARSAVRSALGGKRDRAQEQHARLLEILHTYQEVYTARLDLSAVRSGAEMVFLREVVVRPGDRLLLATGGLTSLAEHRPLWVQRAVARTDPQRVVEWLADGLATLDGRAEDLAVVVLDPEPTAASASPWSWRDDTLWRQSKDQTRLMQGGVVPGVGDGHYPALRIVPRRLAPWYGEMDDLIRRRKLADPQRKPLDFAVGLAKWAAARTGTKAPASRYPKRVQALHVALDERDSDPLDETLLVWFLLRKRGIAVDYVSGVRLQGRGAKADVADTCWLLATIGGEQWVLDVPRAGAQGAVPKKLAYRPGNISLGTGMMGLRKREIELHYVPDAEVFVEFAHTVTADDVEPFLRLNLHSRTKLVSESVVVRTEETTSPGHSAPEVQPQEEEAPINDGGFLDLGF
jgi:serine/threonine protein phosphatase PrpC